MGLVVLQVCNVKMSKLKKLVKVKLHVAMLEIAETCKLNAVLSNPNQFVLTLLSVLQSVCVHGRLTKQPMLDFVGIGNAKMLQRV